MLKRKKIDYIIMNPPYGNLHLKILNNVSNCVAKEIVNKFTGCQLCKQKERLFAGSHQKV